MPLTILVLKVVTEHWTFWLVKKNTNAAIHLLTSENALKNYLWPKIFALMEFAFFRQNDTYNFTNSVNRFV